MRLLIPLIMLALTVSACTDDAPTTKQELVMGFVPSRNVHEIQVSSEKIADYLSEKTGYKIRSITLSNYAAVAVAMKSERVDLAFVGPLSYLVIRENAGAYPITAAVRHGRKGYEGLIIAGVDSGVSSLADLKGKSMAFADALSASGNLYPKGMLIDTGVDPANDLRSIIVSSQSAIVMSVMKGKVDAGAIYDDARLNPEVLKYFPDVVDKTRVIARTNLIPADPQIVRANLDPKQAAKLKAALLEMAADPKAKQWLKELYGIDGLEPADHEEYTELLAIVQKVNPSLLKDPNAL